MLRRNLDTPEHRDYWQFVTDTAREVAQWPAWMRGDYSELPKREVKQTESPEEDGDE